MNLGWASESTVAAPPSSHIPENARTRPSLRQRHQDWFVGTNRHQNVHASRKNSVRSPEPLEKPSFLLVTRLQQQEAEDNWRFRLKSHYRISAAARRTGL